MFEQYKRYALIVKNIWWVICLGIALAGCDGEIQQAPDSTPVQTVNFYPQGEKEISGTGAVLNRYASIAKDLSQGTKKLEFSSIDFDALLPVVTDDLLLIVQMQGAQQNTVNSSSYGQIVDLKSAGLYEWVTVESVDQGNHTIFIKNPIGGLKNSYQSAGTIQVIWVPRYEKITVNNGASVIAQPFDGRTGGIVSIVSKEALIQGELSAKASCFRGGAPDVPVGVLPVTTDVSDYVFTDPKNGAEKGESIVGAIASYDPPSGVGRYGRGAPANGGGGGNAYKSGGGGGANGVSLLNMNPWTGQGAMDFSVTGAAQAWPLDPSYMAPMGTQSPGGGRGGYSSSTAVLDPKTSNPGNMAWGGNYRRERGGLGGHPIVMDSKLRIFCGGGGGAGDQQEIIPNGAGFGGRGGGIIFMIAEKISGIGLITADGQAGGDSSSPNDGAGGGGGGGSIYLHAQTVSGVQISAKGGKGGNHIGTLAETNGPGGGGGGGIADITGGTPMVDLAAGVGGDSASSTLLGKFPRNGATNGFLGSSIVGTIKTDLRVEIRSDVPTLPLPGVGFLYAIRVSNDGPDFVRGAAVQGKLTQMYPDISWNCYTSDELLASCDTKSGIGDLTTLVNLGPGTYVEFVVRLIIPSYVYCEEVNYQVSVNAPSGTVDLDTTNNKASLLLSPPADLELSLSVLEKQLSNPAVQLHFKASVLNKGPYCAKQIKLQIEIPNNTTVVGASGDGWTCSQSALTITCEKAELPVGESTDVAVVLLPSGVTNPFEVRGKVTSASFDPNLSNNSALIRLWFDPQYNTLAGGGLGCSFGATNPSQIKLFDFIVLFLLVYGLFQWTRFNQKNIRRID